MISHEDVFAGKVLKKLRINKEISIRGLGKELGLCYESVNKYEKAKCSLNLKRISSICDFFDVEPNIFFKRTHEREDAVIEIKIDKDF